ncbi:hypothetical protein P170DRAFT_323011, partial [Aspergillus steynii IBT 23096]
QLALDLLEDPNVDKSQIHIHYNSYTQCFELRKLTPILASTETWFRRQFDRFICNGVWTTAERNNVDLSVGRWTDGFAAPYNQSAKEPALQIIPRQGAMPTVVFEAGWKKSFEQMNRDVDLWFHGSAGHVRVVILIKWAIESNGVNGRMEVYRADSP